MGLFFPMEGERHESDARRVGFARYRQVLERDWKELLLLDFPVLATFLPALFLVSFAVLNKSVLVLIPAGLVGGAFASLGIGAMVDFVLRRMRDDLIWCMASFKKSLRQNWKACLLPGALEGLFVSSLIYAGVMMLHAGTFTLLSAGIFALASLVFTLIFRVWWVQAVLFEQSALASLKNCLLFLLRRPKKLLLSALVEVLWWGVTALFMPYTGLLVPIFGIWYITLTGVLIVYDDLNAAFRIEEQIAARFSGASGKGA